MSVSGAIGKRRMRPVSASLLVISLLLTSQAAAQVPFLVKDIKAGAGDGVDSTIQGRIVIGGTVFFRGDDGATGRELWKSDGTTAGTMLVKDINPGIGDSAPGEMTEVGGTLFFKAFDGTNSGLFRSDGTSAGTALVKALSAVQNLVVVSGTLFFVADDSVSGEELWKSDGTPAGTVLVKDINPGAGDGVPVADPILTAAMGGVLFFRGDDGVTGEELWRSDGTAAGTTIVADINPGVAHSFPSYLTALGGVLLFGANDGVNGSELWRSDGTAGGTALVKDIQPGAGSAGATNVVRLGSVVLFAADDGVQGKELWQSDGTAAGTTLVADLSPGAGGSDPGVERAVVGDTLFFTASDGGFNQELWKTKGTLATTSIVKEINPSPSGINGSFPISLIDGNGTLFFGAADTPPNHELWKSDGTAAGTVMVADLNPSGSALSTSQFRPVVAGQLLIFGATDGTAGQELWGLSAPIATTTTSTTTTTSSTTTTTVPPASKCTSRKLSLAGKSGGARTKCHAKAVKTGDAVDAERLQNAADKLAAGWAKAEAPGHDCLSTGELGGIETETDDFVDAVVAVLVPGGGPSSCTAGKLSLAGKTARASTKCHAKGIAKGAAVDGDCLGKASAKFASAWTKLEAPGNDCLTSGDMSGVGNAIEEFVDALLAEVLP